MNSFRLPKPRPPQPCWYCVHYAGPCWGDPALADCRHDPLHPSCVANAATGCAFYLRETGVDDDHWAPPVQVWPVQRPGQQA